MTMQVSIIHPTDRPNFSVVTVGSVRLAFSYSTVIGFSNSWEPWTLRKNVWGPTTGKHLNYLDEDHENRLDSDEFESRLSTILATIG